MLTSRHKGYCVYVHPVLGWLCPLVSIPREISFSSAEVGEMAGGDQQRRRLAGSDHYLDLVDLYAARASRSRTVVAHDARSPVIHQIGRSERLTLRAARSSGHGFRSRRIRIATAA